MVCNKWGTGTVHKLVVSVQELMDLMFATNAQHKEIVKVTNYRNMLGFLIAAN